MTGVLHHGRSDDVEYMQLLVGRVVQVGLQRKHIFSTLLQR
jgi:hypothetical protein